MKKYLIIIFIILSILSSTASWAKEDWEGRLFTPTQISKIQSLYFIADCYNDRILYNTKLDDEISKWSYFTEGLIGPHSIVSDGNIYLVDDTENNMIAVLKKNDNEFTISQRIEVGSRPHMVIYDPETQLFYSISWNGRIDVFKNNNGHITIDNTVHIKEIENSYVRSINIIDGYLYISSGPMAILKVNHKNNFYIEERYPVPEMLSGMNYITKIEDYYYLSSCTDSKGKIKPQFIRFMRFEQLTNGEYEDLYNKFGFEGSPYYISHFDDKHFITEIAGKDNSIYSIKEFSVIKNEIKNIKTLYKFEGITDSALVRYRENRKIKE